MAETMQKMCMNVDLLVLKQMVDTQPQGSLYCISNVTNKCCIIIVHRFCRRCRGYVEHSQHIIKAEKENASLSSL